MAEGPPVARGRTCHAKLSGVGPVLFCSPAHSAKNACLSFSPSTSNVHVHVVCATGSDPASSNMGAGNSAWEMEAKAVLTWEPKKALLYMCVLE